MPSLVQSLCILAGIGLLLAAVPAASAEKDSAPSPDRPAPTAAQPGEYPLDSDRIVEAVARGEGPQVLAYFERMAAQAEQHGQHLQGARAHQAIALAAIDQAKFQKSIQAANRSLELFKTVPPAQLTPSDLVRITQDYWHIGSSYRQIGNLVRARSVLEDGVGFADSQLAGRRDTVIAGIVRNTLALVTY